MSNEGHTNHNEVELHQYIVKVVDESLFIYKLSYKSNLIRINVYGLDEIFTSFPKQILMNWCDFRFTDNLKEKKKT